MIGIYIETRFSLKELKHYAGNFPLWLAPIQVRIIPISERHKARAYEVKTALQHHNVLSAFWRLRVDIDDSDERMQRKILKGQHAKIPYMVILGDKEQESGQLSIRHRNGQQSSDVSLMAFAEKLIDEIKMRRLTEVIP